MAGTLAHASIPPQLAPPRAAVRARRAVAVAASPSPSSSSGTADPWAALRAYTAADAAGRAPALVATREQRAALKAAFLAAAATPNPAAGWDGRAGTGAASPPRLLLAVLASSPPVAARALRDYCAALGVAYAPPAAGFPPGADRGVYVKWRPAGGGGDGGGGASSSSSSSPRVDAAAYAGPDRGVLVTFGSEQVGHLPLGLIDEDRAGPPPRLA